MRMPWQGQPGLLTCPALPCSGHGHMMCGFSRSNVASLLHMAAALCSEVPALACRGFISQLSSAFPALDWVGSTWHWD